MSNTKEVLVVTVGAPMRDGISAEKVFCVEELQTLREYIVESIRKEVLVLDARMALQVKTLPNVCSEDVIIQQGETPTSAVSPASKKLTPREEKQLILERLKDYRERHGLGSLNLIADKTRRKGISGDILRMLLSGDAKLEIQDWRAIGKAMDELEQKGGANG